MSRLPDGWTADLADAAWPAERLAEAISAVAARSGVQSPSTPAPVAHDVPGEQIGAWVDAAAAHAGFQADQTFAALDELEDLLAEGAPLLLRLAAIEQAPFLAIVGTRRRSVVALTPAGDTQRLPIALLAATIREPFEAPVAAAVDDTLDRLALTARRRRRGRLALLHDRLALARFRGCWLLRPAPGGSIAREARDARVPARVAALVAAYVGQYALFVGSWWLLGQTVLSGVVNRGWLLGWLLLLASLIPLRLAATWQQGLVTISIGAWLRRQLLRGAFHVDRQELRRKGVGQLFTLVVEAAALDTMALSGGLAAAFALVELAGAALVLWWGASLWPIAGLALWVVVTVGLAGLYFRRRRWWTSHRLAMSHDLLESMMGHRTRLAQQPSGEHHEREDDALDQALTLGHTMDATGVWLLALAPRGWLVVALAALIPSLTRGASATALAVSLGGVLLAFRALQRLTAGMTNLTGAMIAAASLAPLARAARLAAPSPVPYGTLANIGQATKKREAAIQAKDLVFRYHAQGEPTIAGATLTIDKGARYLLEGASGSGKTTFGAMLAGLVRPESGLLLAGGLDRAALGAAGWGARVVMAPQSHDNYLVGGSLAFNLLMGRRWPAEPAELREAEALCRELGLGELLDRLPGGLDQIVGETGWQLSQGERVRVFLARALLQRPDLLVLDESFSALDPENLDRAIRTVSASGTAVLAIAHL